MESDFGDSPFPAFKEWMDNALAAKLPEPNAMTLATVDSSGMPSARIVLLKGFDERGFVFYTNYSGDKASDLARNRNAALVFSWLELQRQVRVQGKAEKISFEESKAYFDSRPEGSRIGAWVSPQSRVIQGREPLDEMAASCSGYFKGKDEIPLPPFWGGYRVVPSVVEFWQGRTSRLHDRIRFCLESGSWIKERLAP